MEASILSQWKIIRRDKWLLSCLTWIPVALSVMIWAIFSQGIARDLPVGVVDLNHSSLSNQFTRYLDASPTMAVTHEFTSITEAEQALVESEVYAYVVLPYNLEENIYKGFAPQISAFYNSQTILIGKLLSSAITQVQGTFNAQISTVQTLSRGNTTFAAAMGNAVPVRTQITPLFNKNSNYAQFLVTAIVPALWQIVVVVGTILVLAANLRLRGLQPWLGNRTLSNLVLTLRPYFAVFLLQGFAFLCWFFLGFEWPLNGSLLAMVAAQAVMTLACMIMGCFFFFMTLDAARAMSFAGAFTAPSFAFMGITFPVSDMNPLALFWRSLLPVSHYIEVQIHQANYGEPWTHSLQYLLPMLGYLLPLVLTVLLIRIHLTKEGAL
ncbi:ABC transporter permease [Vibrio sinensis]|uniref:ABC transporter permease n=1 Tax=Vibrio sinensis TaxID=2302434 RepID=A0A3A6R8M4_9VIBR|nr:ABC transporter permease [Vibrio sinensis]RJX72871.1 ABC transporter permease [Vibrio sinensis]